MEVVDKAFEIATVVVVVCGVVFCILLLIAFARWVFGG
jgi:hypothetical protein